MTSFTNYTNVSILTGTTNSMNLAIEPDVFDDCLHIWKGGALIQHAFPMLTFSEREFIKSGITPDEWNKIVSNIKVMEPL